MTTPAPTPTAPDPVALQVARRRSDAISVLERLLDAEERLIRTAPGAIVPDVDEDSALLRGLAAALGVYRFESRR